MEFRQFLARWEKEAPLCTVEASRFEALVTETPTGPITREPKKILTLLERIKWAQERTMRLEAVRHLAQLPASVSDADYLLLQRFGCRLSASFDAVRALARRETAQARRAPDRRVMKAVGNYVDAGPATSLVQLLAQWSLLRELSISPYYMSRVPQALAAEMDAFALRIKGEREEASRRAEPRDNYESYVNFRADTLKAIELQRDYDAILFKLRGVFFR